MNCIINMNNCLINLVLLNNEKENQSTDFIVFENKKGENQTSSNEKRKT